MALIEKQFVERWSELLDTKLWKAYFNGGGSSYLDSFTPKIRLSETDQLSSTMSLKSINDYLKTRSDLLPTCRRCEKKVDGFEMTAPGMIRFRCHNETSNEAIPQELLVNQDKLYDYLVSLKNHRVFSLHAPAAASWQLNTLATSSRSPFEFDIVPFVKTPTRKQSIAPKTPPRLAPILPTKPAKRAITFDD